MQNTIEDTLREAAVQGRIDAAVRIVEHAAAQEATRVQAAIGKVCRDLQYREAMATRQGRHADAEIYRYARKAVAAMPGPQGGE